MNTSIRIGVAIAVLACAMTQPARAEVLPGYTCDANSLWTFEWTSVTVSSGTYHYLYGCTESGWLLFGTAYCDNDGNCYSD